MRLRLSKQAIDDLTNHAMEGYEKKDKKEVGGHLLGSKCGNDLHISRAEPYRTRYGSRTSWNPNPLLFERRGNQLENTRLKWVGVYHSHVEVRGSASTQQSCEDKIRHAFSSRPIEIIIRVTNYPMKWPRICLSYENGYFYDICGYINNSRGQSKKIKVVEGR